MDSTPVSLLDRLREPEAEEAWREFVGLYTPLLYHWARRVGLCTERAADLVQDVFVVLVRKLPEFRYEPGRRFRGWLWTVLLNKYREHQRRSGEVRERTGIEHLGDAAVPDPTVELAEEEYRRFLVQHALRLMQSKFEPTTWRACWEHVVSGRSAAEVAADLGISAEAVRAAKFRVLCRLRKELEGLLD